jgi:hypothetical protein
MKIVKRASIVGIAVTSLVLAQAAPAQPKVQNSDSAEEIAKDAARDLKDNRFYNKPGATRAQYDADWQECRLIARGSQLPRGSSSYYNPMLYNPSISPLAAGIGGGLGAAIAGAIAEGAARRENRKRCLLIRGWRMVKLPAEKAAAVSAMTDEAKESYFNSIIGAAEVSGEIEKKDSFTPPSDPALKVAAGLAAPATLWLHKDPAKAVMPVLAANQGAIVVAFNRNHSAAKDRFGRLEMYRYDAAKGDLHYQPRDWKKKGDLTTYVVPIAAGDRRAGYELRVIPVTAGDYVLGGWTIGTNTPAASSFCFGAPMISVKAGEYVYLADATPVMGAQLADGSKTTTMVLTRNHAQAQVALARLRPELAGKLVEGAIRNRASYSCASVTMDRYDWPGAEDLAATTVAPAGAGGSR